jgi:hypothetical protein
MVAIDAIPLLSGAIVLFSVIAYIVILPFTAKATEAQLRSIGEAQNEAAQNQQYLVHPVSLRDPHSASGYVITVAFFSFLALAIVISQSPPGMADGASTVAAEMLVIVWVVSTLLYVIYLLEGKDLICFVSVQGIELRKYGISGKCLSRPILWKDILRVDTGENESGTTIIHIYGTGGQSISLRGNWINVDYLYRDILRSATWGIYTASAFKHMSKHAAPEGEGPDMSSAPIPVRSEVELWDESFPPKE